MKTISSLNKLHFRPVKQGDKMFPLCSEFALEIESPHWKHFWHSGPNCYSWSWMWGWLWSKHSSSASSSSDCRLTPNTYTRLLAWPAHPENLHEPSGSILCPGLKRVHVGFVYVCERIKVSLYGLCVCQAPHVSQSTSTQWAGDKGLSYLAQALAARVAETNAHTWLHELHVKTRR